MFIFQIVQKFGDSAGDALSTTIHTTIQIVHSIEHVGVVADCQVVMQGHT